MKSVKNLNIEKLILEESKGLSERELSKVLHFTQELKKVSSGKKKTSRSKGDKLKKELNNLNSSELSHLEKEFENYKELYPVEK